ncbi:alpha/beta fold hydrolase [Marilutibacter aestuarii]|uniref:Alpha/beta hydrolase n=1 Tax=Marilutibacter aestuarii TaxID=1706195 RepID=A0A507ZRD1_9GAMM|nr:alpha/beta fold hydrolase [Lysobacter aestuarii]TQD40336.1 alpha/beta hydrolase [Lysobacter aestuarii]
MSLADRIATPSPLLKLPIPPTGRATLASMGIEEGEAWTAEGVRIHYLTVPVRAFDVDARYQRDAEGYLLHWNLSVVQDEPPPSTRGTIVYLHGWGNDGSMMLPWATALARQGYRGILPDLRHHGRSDEAPPGFGPREARDILQLLPGWREQGLVEGPVYLFGLSYGAATAIFMAAQADEAGTGQPTALIAIAPFDNAATAIERFARELLDGDALPWFVRRHHGMDELPDAIAEAGRKLDVDLASIDASQAAAATSTCMLLVEGGRDRLVPAGSARRIADAAPHARQVTLPLETHMTAGLRLDWLAVPFGEWLQEVADTAGCPAIDLPPDPAD